MSFQGKQLPAEMVEAVVRVKKYCDEEKKSGKLVSTKDSAKRTADALGIGIATVKRIMAQYKKDGNEVVVRIKERPGRPPSSLCPLAQPIVREFVRNENLGGRRVSIGRVCKFLNSKHGIDIPKMTLWRALNRWGFNHGEGRRRNSLKEQDRIILARREYLRAKLANRKPDGTLKRPEVYLDETYINKNHSCRFTWYLKEEGPMVNKPSGVGPRFILVHAITENGWVDGAQLVFEAKKRTGDYHGQMNWENFSTWFETQLLPNIPTGAMVILDNARYHNVLDTDLIPNSSSKKEQLRGWLTRNGYPWREDMLKSELLDLCTRLAPAPEYKLDQIADQHGIFILRTPPYHPELQPIETCWAVLKNHMADNCDFTMAGLRKRLPEAFAKVTANTCKGIISKVFEQENKYWAEDEKLDEIYSKNAEEEYLGKEAFESQGDEFYLEAV
ncbi:MAG: transposase [Deltaproteobacteria bacterium]|nr:transposase [Deltaproteobacteria bacterium]